MDQESFERLFEAFMLGELPLRNRLVMNAMTTGFADPNGWVTDQLLDYYSARAAGGVGLVTVELAGIYPQTPHVRNALGIFVDQHIAGLQELTRRIHAEGAAASVQIGIYFRQHVSGFPRYSTNEKGPDDDSPGISLNREEIDFLIRLFADAAVRVKLSGFDAVEVHACHGCLLCEFLSPYWNKRTDEYGGNQENRNRFLLQVIEAIRVRVGPYFPVIARISASEFSSEGLSPEDALHAARSLESVGVTAISVTGGLAHKDHIAIASCHVPRGVFLTLSQTIRKEVGVPLIVGNSLTPMMAAQALEWGQADLIGLGRPLIADAQWPSKLKRGRLKEIRPCIRCNQGCIGGLRDPYRGKITCLYNPLVGREGEILFHRSGSRKRVLIVGGGPAGCECARVCRIRGHEVALLEKSKELGGSFRLAAVPPGKEDFKQLLDFYQRELSRLGVDVRLETEGTPELLQTLGADYYILATGAKPAKSSIPGSDMDHVITAFEFLSHTAVISRGPVVVVGGGATGLETALVLAAKGFEVTVVEALVSVGRDITGVGVREYLLFALNKSNVTVLTGHRLTRIEEDRVIISERPLTGGGREIRIPARVVVFASGVEPQDRALEESLPSGAKVYRIGDCKSAGDALRAIHEAFELACRI
jgi:2,4-dienoyl-CoA reductase-like NADH-dependent reductase (Old Yellow Enzyme family)/NADPH-dependent 2,4-dienoyl-CoA reductase/sulfur reductase-like enzyme